MASSLKRGELTAKDMSVLREDTSAKTQSKRNSGYLRDYSLQHVVKMSWNENTDRDLRPFTLKIDGDKYYMSYGELKDISDAGFFRKERPNATLYKLKYLTSGVTVDVRLNEEAERDLIFRLKTDKHEVLLDWYELMRYGRFL